ncbi:toll/interleukin-1 receptor domain-containing protein [Ruminococcus albus]|uniref:toll/interleukin-1 receptor domain-containing protein n=1 Tax=Ruminococcus albus TaxID=1264 RepID=UPI0001E0DF0A|nr:toll/interleukin-1 receptor domain-containing protein [Ruminococcus albus]
MSKQHPKAFISYSWEEDAHQQWVREFADKLLADGIDATVDQYDASLGDRLPHFMEQSITTADYVLIICTPLYKEKADNRKGGVGYEGHIITEELYSKGNERKFIPVVRKGSFNAAMPTFLAGKLGIDLTDSIHFENNYKDLITTIYGVKMKPKIGRVPSYVAQAAPQLSPSSPDEPIHILGIITDEVTVPRMDGTRGCALYNMVIPLTHHK